MRRERFGKYRVPVVGPHRSLLQRRAPRFAVSISAKLARALGAAASRASAAASGFPFSEEKKKSLSRDEVLRARALDRVAASLSSTRPRSLAPLLRRAFFFTARVSREGFYERAVKERKQEKWILRRASLSAGTRPIETKNKQSGRSGARRPRSGEGTRRLDIHRFRLFEVCHHSAVCESRSTFVFRSRVETRYAFHETHILSR